MKTIIFSSLTLLLLSACSSAPAQEKKTSTVANDKIEAVNDAKAVVKKIEKNSEQSSLVIASAPSTGASIFSTKCASCHGKDAKKSALNTSAIIASWPEEKIQAALHGYQEGTYGGKMKAIMQGQTKSLSSEDIQKLAKFISSL